VDQPVRVSNAGDHHNCRYISVHGKRHTAANKHRVASWPPRKRPHGRPLGSMVRVAPIAPVVRADKTYTKNRVSSGFPGNQPIPSQIPAFLWCCGFTSGATTTFKKNLRNFVAISCEIGEGGGLDTREKKLTGGFGFSEVPHNRS